MAVSVRAVVTITATLKVMEAKMLLAIGELGVIQRMRKQAVKVLRSPKSLTKR
jgi:hypothetical protein